MEEKKINYKLLNTVLILAICFLFYNTLGLWKFVVDKVIAIISPFIISFAIAYALYPLLKKLQQKAYQILLLSDGRLSSQYMFVINIHNKDDFDKIDMSIKRKGKF